jgi:hypothetical protein|tara:strand:- start:1 stop:180 length:180 start_codon:yes stop_codon:yes gene_type:complete
MQLLDQFSLQINSLRNGFYQPSAAAFPLPAQDRGSMGYRTRLHQYIVRRQTNGTDEHLI